MAVELACEAISTARLVAPGGRLQHAFERQARAFATQLDLPAGNPHLIAPLELLAAVVTKLVVLDRPFADALLAHRERGQRSVASVNVGPVHLVGDLHAGELCADLRAGQLLELLRGGGARQDGARAGEHDHQPRRSICKRGDPRGRDRGTQSATGGRSGHTSDGVGSGTSVHAQSPRQASVAQSLDGWRLTGSLHFPDALAIEANRPAQDLCAAPSRVRASTKIP